MHHRLFPLIDKRARMTYCMYCSTLFAFQKKEIPDNVLQESTVAPKDRFLWFARKYEINDINHMH